MFSFYLYYQTLNVLCTNNNSKRFSFLTRIWVCHEHFHSHSTLASSHPASCYLSPVHPCSRCWGSWLHALLPGKILPEVLFGSQLLKTSLQIPQNFIHKKKTRRSFALIELDLTCCCLYQLLWKENRVETESGAWQTFPSSPCSSSNIDDFLSAGSVCISCAWICMPVLIAEQINLLQTICCCYNVCKYVISRCKK